jgi:Uma2 family endonuclease
MSTHQEQPAVELSEGMLPPIPPELWPDIEHLVTEDDTPVDNFFSAKNQRLLVEPLYSTWAEQLKDRSFLADANVGVFYSIHAQAVVPDAFLSLDVRSPDGWWEKRHRSYFIWELGKPPDVAIEIVSNRKGQEADAKIQLYAQIRILYYCIFDPDNVLGDETLRIYELRGGVYVPLETGWLPQVGLGLKLWQGSFEGRDSTWLRWYSEDGNVIASGAERAWQERQRADEERQRADEERQRADEERQRADEERQRAERLAVRLRELGIDPDKE